MSGISISAARTNLYTLVAADAGAGSGTALAGIQVTFGDPIVYEELEVASLMGVVDPNAEEAAIGAQRQEERYGLEWVIKIEDPAGTAAEVDARGFAVADALRDVVHANPTLGGAVRLARVRGYTTDGAEPRILEDDNGQVFQQGWAIFITLTIACVQRIPSRSS